jgi:hypothetical protein
VRMPLHQTVHRPDVEAAIACGTDGIVKIPHSHSRAIQWAMPVATEPDAVGLITLTGELRAPSHQLTPHVLR